MLFVNVYYNWKEVNFLRKIKRFKYFEKNPNNFSLKLFAKNDKAETNIYI